MDKFRTVDLSGLFNANRSNEPLQPGGPPPWHPEMAKALQELPGGQQSFWGVPFDLGPGEGGGKCWVVLGPGLCKDVTVPLSGKASFILFSHFCNSSPKTEDGSYDFGVGTVTKPGQHLADYILIYEDGTEERHPIRRRFELNDAVVRWGHLAFAAKSSREDQPIDWRGPAPRNGWGRTQTAVEQGAYGAGAVYWVYALPNPHPERELKGLRLESTGADSLAVAGITLYYGGGHPLRHRQLETLRIALPREEKALPEEVQATIDLGIIARKYALPSFDPQAWLEELIQGWGEEKKPDEPSSELFLDVTAADGATLNVAGHEVEMKEVYERGGAKSGDGKARVELLTPRRTWVHVAVEDATTGKPTPVRVHFRAPDGRYFPPYGHRHEVNDNWFEDYGGDLKLGNVQYAYVPGDFQIELPVGDVYVEIVKGFEYQPLRAKLAIEPGQRELKLRIQRPIDLRREGWVTADTHVHFLSPQTAWLEAQAEGLNLLNLLASQWGDLFTNVADITGNLSGASGDDTIIWVGTENRQHLLGHMSLLGVKGNPVYPMCAGGPGESYLGDPTWISLGEWADRCREREGVVVIPHFPNPYCEVVPDIVLGKVDGVEIRDFYTGTLDTFGVREWYRFLNCGYRVSAVGGTDKMSAGMPVGGVRTYVFIGDEEFSFANWGKAVRAGRTFTTSGPLIGLAVEGYSPGDEIKLPAGGGTLEVEAWAQSIQPFHELQVVANGSVVAQERSEGGTKKTRLKAKVKMNGSGWIAARCTSSLKVWHIWPVHVAAHTSPVYIMAGGKELFSPSDATYMLTMIEGGLTWLDTLSIPADESRYKTIRRVFEDARGILHRRLHAHGVTH
ncbi:MAG: CehA/McbA family metallohydrolase [bacterium]